QEQIIQVEGCDRSSVSLELDLAQRADWFDAATHEERIGDRRETADCVRTGAMRIAEDEHTNRTELSDIDARLSSDHLIADATFKVAAHVLEAHPAHSDGADFREVAPAITPDHEGVVSGRIPEQLNFDGVAWTHHVLRRHWNVCRRRKCRWN